jgi:cobalt-precorrin-5B (C1)-methyltransferase
MNKTATTPDKVRKGDGRRQRGNRSGFTTGACAAAAARAATLGLINGSVPESVTCRLPNGQEVSFPVFQGHVDGHGNARIAHAVIVKDAGDDPDATNGARLMADVCLLPGLAGEIRLQGGSGVGTVTKEGLGLDVNGPAINPVPRRNIGDNIRAVASELLDHDGLEVTISVPGGEEMAKKTLNARLGILGGISILGTTGIVRPYSTAAFRASVVQAIDVAARQGQTSTVFTTGGRSEKFAMRQLSDLDEACFVQMGDFVKAAFQTAIRRKMTHIYVGAMAGKLTKMGQGLTVTHAWKAEIDRDLLAECAREVGASPDLIEEIRNAETARFAAERLAALGLAVEFHRALAGKAIRSLKSCYPGDYRLTILVCDFDGEFICRLEDDETH